MGMKGASLDEIEALYRSRFEAFRKVAGAIAGDSEAYDLVQDAFATAVRKRKRFRRDAALEAWVWRIVLNRARDRHRRRRVRPAAEAASNGSVPTELREEVHVAVAGLGERQRTIVFLRYYADLEYAAIARALGISEGTVAATLHTAHSRLRHALEEVDR